jgi:thiazole synthase
MLGTARYESPKILVEAINAADPAMVTVALRRQVQGGRQAGQSFWGILRSTGRTLLPNTAGCYTAKEAVNTALMARELFETDFLKLEVIGDDQNLQPDPFALVEADWRIDSARLSRSAILHR